MNEEILLLAIKNINPNLFPQNLGGCFGKMNWLEWLEERGYCIQPPTNLPSQNHLGSQFTPPLTLHHAQIYLIKVGVNLGWMDLVTFHHWAEHNFSSGHASNQGWLRIGVY
jgi:hypothetical protein